MQILQEKNRGDLFWEIKRKLNIIVVLHFWYIYDILQAEVFCDA